MTHSVGFALAQGCGLKAVAAWRDQRPKAGVAQGHAEVAHLAEPADVPSACARAVTMIAAGAGATGGSVARVAATAAQA
jgi:hypothetical protein